MILRQFLDTYPVVAASYLVGCGGRGVAAVIDPLEGIERYVEAADSLGMRIRYVIDTHVHADHLSSGRVLAEAAAADYVLWGGVASTAGTRGVEDGESLEIGNVRLGIWHTPGHTPEHLSLLVTDGTRGPEPWSVFTGHTLMVGDMGRTELAGTGEEGARQLYRSARRLAQLPDHVEVLPGAFSGSVCGRGLSGKPWSTIGFERRFNRAFRLTDEAEFVSYMLQDTPPPPAAAAETRARNLGVELQEA